MNNDCSNAMDPPACAQAFCSAFAAGEQPVVELFNCVCNTCGECVNACSS